MGKLNNRLLVAVRRNDMETARLEQRRAQAVIRLLQKYGGRSDINAEEIDIIIIIICERVAGED